MIWIAIGVVFIVYIVCECVSERVARRYEQQENICDCDDCPMRYECRGCNK